MNKILQFKPGLFIRNPHIQTLLSYSIKRFPELVSESHFLELLDKDRLTLEVSIPNTWSDNNPTVLMMPGIGGSHQSPYLIRMAHKCFKQGYKVIRLNFRGVGSGLGYAKNISHGGASDDLHCAIQEIKKLTPNSPLFVIGFSLSGNILLKLAGEKDLSPLVIKIIAVCPAVNLADSSQRLAKWQNRIYQKSILKSIIKIIEHPHSKFSYKPLKPFSTCKTLREFDELFTAPSSGFNNVDEYYRKCSSLDLISDINIPCHILFAQDDPLIDCTALQKMQLPQNIELVITRYGGHMGFLSSSIKDPFWMDQQLLHWLSMS